MKKFILPIFVALMATVCFVACSDDTDEMSDEELKVAIINIKDYSNGQTGSDYEEIIFTTDLAVWTWDDDVIAQGTWTVINKEVVITDNVNGTYTQVGKTSKLTVLKEGKELKDNIGGSTFKKK